jgi:hypothetical protein
VCRGAKRIELRLENDEKRMIDWQGSQLKRYDTLGTEEWLEGQEELKNAFEEIPQTCGQMWNEASGGE